MLPSNFQVFLLTLLFIAPGFLFARSYWRDLPRYYEEPNLFHQTVSTIIASTVIHSLLLFLIGGAVLVYTGLKGPNIGEIFKPLPDYPVGEFITRLLAFVAYSGLSLGLGWFGGSRWQRWFPVEIPIWASLMANLRARGIKEPQFKVRLRNGEEYTGTLKSFRWVGSKDMIYELILTNVSYKQVNASSAEERTLLHHRVLLLSSDILWLGCKEVPPQEGASS